MDTISVAQERRDSPHQNEFSPHASSQQHVGSNTKAPEQKILSVDSESPAIPSPVLSARTDIESSYEGQSSTHHYSITTSPTTTLVHDLEHFPPPRSLSSEHGTTMGSVLSHRQAPPSRTEEMRGMNRYAQDSGWRYRPDSEGLMPPPYTEH